MNAFKEINRLTGNNLDLLITFDRYVNHLCQLASKAIISVIYTMWKIL